MIEAHQIELDTWILRFGGTAVVGYLCTLLIIGKYIHYLMQKRGLFLGFLVVPPALLSGIIGFIIFSIIRHTDDILSFNFSEGLDVIKLNLVNFVFAALSLGLSCSRSSSKHSNFRGMVASLFHEGMPMIIYSQILMWGQTVCCLLVVCVGNMFGGAIPPLFAAMVPLGLEAGNDVLPVTIRNNYWSDTVVVESESVGMIMTCCFAILLLSSRGFVSSLGLFPNYAPAVGGEDVASGTSSGGGNVAEAFNRKRRRSTTVGITNHYNFEDADVDNIERVDNSVLQVDNTNTSANEKADSAKMHVHFSSLGTHISFISLAVFLSFATMMLARFLEIELGLNESHLFSGIRMFKLSMFFAWCSMQMTLRKTGLKFNRDWFMRLCGFLLDVLMIAACSSASPRPLSLDRNFLQYGLVLLFAFVCFAWNMFCFFVLAYRLFPNYSFERGLVLMADCMGHSYSGLLFARTMDPLMETPVPAAYAYKLILFFVPSSGGKNSIVISLTDQHGPWMALMICLCVVASWFLIFEKFFRHRFVNAYSSQDLLGEANETLLSPDRSDKRNKNKHVNVDVDEEHVGLLSEQTKSSTPLDGRGKNMRKTVHSSAAGDTGIELQFSALASTPIQMNAESSLLSSSHIQTILSWLPAERRLNAWELSYSLRRDGASLDTLMSLCSRGDVSTSYSVVDNVSNYSNRTINRSMSSATNSSIAHLVIIEDSWG